MKKIFQTIKTLDKKTTIRTILQILVYVNQAIAIFGSSLGSSVIYQWVTFIVTIIFTGLTYWKNNNWSGAAKTAGTILDILKDGKITQEEIRKFIDAKTANQLKSGGK